MINFYNLKLLKIKDPKDNFVGIRKSKSGNSFEFCLPNGFQDFPENDFDQVRELFFKMYRTFRKFERDNESSKRFQKNKPKYQQEQDQTTLSSKGISIQTEDGEICVLYSKIKMIEKVLEAYDNLTLQSIQKKVKRSHDIDYSQIHRYLDRAVYSDSDTIYVDLMDLPRPTVRYESTDLVHLYCYILDEIVQQLHGDVPDIIKVHSQDINFLAQHFKDDYLTYNQSIFDKDTFIETIIILKEALDNIDKNTYYKDDDYWGIYEAVETFLYGELNPKDNDGYFWGIQGFSLIWEDMCHTYFFTKNRDAICFADTDIPLKEYQNSGRKEEEKNRVGNFQLPTKDDNGNSWIYQTPSHIPYPKQEGFFGWDELLCIEFDPQPGCLVYSDRNLDDFHKRDRTKAMRRFPRPDLLLKYNSEDSYNLYIIDYKDIASDFYDKNLSRHPEQVDEKYRFDLIKQLTYELALQQINKVNVSENWFFIPYFYDKTFKQNFKTEINIKGIKIVKANFSFIQEVYLLENYDQ
ncbi:LlaJI family restriction endonuclease [Aetokthonos hydrillicola Thurmond2011]|jgi:hypothetical protein|uniref:LlaJI family restriction endonuclease n=1 Tax=Aetokthonos hydrillicola Thurmond2011 TaxID=2712845 RepID=A0AAP5IAT1_9CYAN|nr:LlaJI family restriction endonuclease [Aetokthonos hydrillicola]MBO3461484.1 LlaJI family restriction endonuclease [Aetokthonos hydrillicola CCALA 1050]MBW4584877.1 LlaJI family restriction endonuclease [Aetokthonos hydrillicola CCALA 1050]MDR9898091.1 LlaJI family restriction endonuclease [Aetokthonos hydrillicola Thurmond2011]